MPAAPRHLSFASTLALFWALVAVMCAVLIGLVWFMAAANEGRQIGLARQTALGACETVASRYDLSTDRTAKSPQPNIDLMHAILDVVLAQMQGVEGGFWSSTDAARGTLDAYAYPTYQGSGIKRDIPEAETPLILRTLREAAARHASASESVEGQDDAVVVAACPVPHRDMLFAWSLTRAHPPLGPYGKTLVSVLAVLLATIVLIAIALGILLRRWRANLARIETSLTMREPQGDAFVPVASTGEPDLDKIVGAFNAYGAQTAALQRQAVDLNARLAGAERFAALGRLAAQVAHEIRNPIGAMRLKAENALAGDADRRHHALVAILSQIQRVEGQLTGLLALTQPVRIEMHPVRLEALLAERLELHRDAAVRAGVSLALADGSDMDALDMVDSACLDAEQIARAVDNLVLNAVRHTPAGGHVTLLARRLRDTLRIEVADDGPGVPLGDRERIFEPFVTGHPAGSGLGLAVVREIAAAHGGRAFLDARDHGACFVIEIPWRIS
jgi:two-component system, NtrC family, sensor histidine kinase HydH